MVLYVEAQTHRNESVGKLKRSTTCEEKLYCFDAHDCSTHVCLCRFVVSTLTKDLS